MMATSMSQESICSLVKDGTLELETEAGSEPNYNGVLVTDDMLLVTDRYQCNLKIYGRHDGKLLSSHRLESHPRDVCLISKTEVAMCVWKSIVILSFKSIEDVKLVKTLDVRTGFTSCYSVAKFNSEKLVVSGVDGIMLCWGVVSIKDGRVDSTHNICKWFWYGFGIGDIYHLTHLAIKDNTVYISCLTSDSTIRGVYAYDTFNPHTYKFLYQHESLKTPGSLMADRRDFIYVSDRDSNRIHQLTDSGQLVTIHIVPSILRGVFCDDQHGVLYTTRQYSNVITLYKIEYSLQPDQVDDSLNEDVNKVSAPHVQKLLLWSSILTATFRTNGDGDKTLDLMGRFERIKGITPETSKQIEQTYNRDSVEQKDQTEPLECPKLLQGRTLPPGKKYHAFFSYSSSDIQWVKQTIERLEKDHGFVCHEYDRDNTPGTPLLNFADDAIRHSCKTVIIMTREAFRSGFVLHEIQMAINLGFSERRNCVVPVLLEDCEVPGYLRVLNYIDARDTKNRNVWWPKILMELETKANDTQSAFEIDMSAVNSIRGRTKGI